MGRSLRPLCLALIAAVLASCNTGDALTPRADVGRGTPRASSPVTQADSDRMARAQSDSAIDAGGGPRDGYRVNPQNTLEAQARALEAGNASSPASSGPPPQWNGQMQAQAPASASSNGGQNASLPAGGEAAATVRFLPIIGAPVQAVTPLSRQLGAEARASGLTIRPSGDTSTRHILKGYFSAFADGGKVTVIYVWDILDASGNRLHRMQGQDVVAAKGSDPWAAVPASTMEQIGTKTIRDYLNWRSAHAG